MVINKHITSVNRNVMSNKVNKYIVIHYVGAVSTAYNNVCYFKDEYRGASAHYFVDDKSIWQCVLEKDSAWHCGTKGKYYNNARNNNSIGIEMCCYKNNGKLDISNATINNTIELVKDIMKRYNIPVENVVRHYDVTRKVCPAPFVNNDSRWVDFKNRLKEDSKPVIYEDKINVIYQSYDNKKKKWLGIITNYDNNSINGYAGNFGNSMGGIRVKLSNGAKITIKSHIKSCSWLSEITKWDNTSNGYSGIKGKDIDGVCIKAEGCKLEYRVKTLNGKWLGWISKYDAKDWKNGVAGIKGKEIDAIQIRVVE